MAVVSQAANYIEKALGHGKNAFTEQDMTNAARDREKYADPSGETMQALAWMGKNDVQVRTTTRKKFFSPTERSQSLPD